MDRVGQEQGDPQRAEGHGEAGAVYRGKPGGEFRAIVGSVRSPADIGWDAKRSRLLVPRFDDNEVDVCEIK